ncbi:MAG: nitroreductase family protein [Acholeplasmataceae bacterium]|nr:nitroreductase family protein [Acholeplasmataceae bacterium]
MSIILERRAIRKYDSNIKISKEEMKTILDEATRAPSSMNMQPWRFVVVSSHEGKEQLKSVLKGNQLQLETSAAMIVIFTDIKKYDLAEKIFDKAVQMNLMPEDVKEKQLRNISNMIPYLKDESIEKAGMVDGGLVAMQLMLIAKEHGYDTCPIGGFDHDKIANVLGLDEKRYKPVMIVSIGKKAEDGYHSVRLDVDDITYWM